MPELSEGKHTVEFSAESLVYYSSPNRTYNVVDYPDKYFFTSRSDEIAFFADTAESNAESGTESASLPWLPVAAVSVVVAAAVAVVYLKKPRR